MYGVTLLAMLFLQRHHEARWRDVGDFLEELTTTRYFGAAMIVLWLLSRVLHNNLLLALAGLVILAGPAVVSLLAKDKKTRAIFLRNIAYAAEPVVAAMTNSGHKLPHNLQTRILQINLLGDIGKVPDWVYPGQILQPLRHVFYR